MVRFRCVLLVALAAGVCMVRGDEASAAEGADYSGYHNNKKLYFKPTESSTFKLVKLGNVNVTFLDKTNLLGYDGQDMAKVNACPAALCMRAVFGPVACVEGRALTFSNQLVFVWWAAWEVQRGDTSGNDHALQQC